MSVKRLLYKAFIGGEWKIGYREQNTGESVRFEFAEADLPEGQWVADPFLFEYQGEHYLFCEQYDKKAGKAGIGYFIFENGIPRNKGIIISQPYHMSYPCVFSYNDVIYMIPETSANKTIELYRAVDFPHQWKLEEVLLRGEQYVDSTVFKADGKTYLLSYIKHEGAWHLDTFELDIEKAQLDKVSRMTYWENVGRPAGSVIYVDGGLLRPAQDCSKKYGDAMLMYKMVGFRDGIFDEQLQDRVTTDMFEFSNKAHRIHTLNRDSVYEVVDVFQERFELLHAWKIFKRSVMSRL